MITCPNCVYPNLEGAVQCSRCKSPLPAKVPCPSCSTLVQADATFCGQCGASLAALRSRPELDDDLAEYGSFSLISPAPAAPLSPAQVQSQQASLQHIGTGVTIDLPLNLGIIRIGKPNDRVPPDIDVSGFPHAEVVSRVHANILLQARAYYIEDAGSANGTYVNNLPVALGSRHQLQGGDRIALGKADKVSFLFQLRP